MNESFKPSMGSPAASENGFPPLSAEGEARLLEVKAEDAALLPQELTQEPREELVPEVRESLYQRVLQMNVPEKIRLAMLGNRNARNLLIHDANRVIATAVLRSPRITEDEILIFSRGKNVPADSLQMIAAHRSWVKNYAIKLALVTNPKTPLAIALRLLPHLFDRDLKALSRSKGVAGTLARSALRTLMKREGKE